MIATVQPTTSLTSQPRWTLRRIFAVNRGRILLTYALFNLENLLRLSQPLVLGWAINGLLQSSYVGLLWFIAQHLSHLAIGSLRRAYDTRVYTRIFNEIAAQFVVNQRANDVDTSTVTARSALSRAMVDFFEQDIPVVLRTLYLVLGALAMLLLYDPWLAPLCLLLLAPAVLINYVYSRKTQYFNRRLHDQLEQEVDVIETAQPLQVRNHYSLVGRWRIKLSDWEALNFGLIELFILGVMAATLIRACTVGAAAGDVFAIFRYMLMFVMGLDAVPLLVQKMSRVRDIARRLA